MEMQRSTPAIGAMMYDGAKNETQADALIALALDQSLPPDIRKVAAEGLNDHRGAALGYIRTLNDKALLLKLSRCGLVANEFLTFAKARLETVKKGNNPEVTLKIIALLEEQKRLLMKVNGKVV